MGKRHAFLFEACWSDFYIRDDRPAAQEFAGAEWTEGGWGGCYGGEPGLGRGGCMLWGAPARGMGGPPDISMRGMAMRGGMGYGHMGGMVGPPMGYGRGGGGLGSGTSMGVGPRMDGTTPRFYCLSLTRPCSDGYGDGYGGGRGVVSSYATKPGRKPIGPYMPTGVVVKGAPPDEKVGHTVHRAPYTIAV